MFLVGGLLALTLDGAIYGPLSDLSPGGDGTD